jgi:hypothetical protein
VQIDRFLLEITLTEPMLGTVPKNPDIYADYIATRVAERKAMAGDTDDKAMLATEEVATVMRDEEKGWTGFHTDDEGIFVYDYLIKGFIKEAGNVLKDVQDVKAMRSKLDSYLFVFPRRIRFHRGDDFVTEADGVFERPLRAMTAQGPRVTLVRSDTVNAGTLLTCEIRLLPHKELNEKRLRDLLDYGQFQGLGQFRNGSFGRFTYELAKISED